MKTFAALTTAVAAVALLAGCAGGTSGGSDTEADAPAATSTPTQSVAEGCEVLNDQLDEYVSEITSGEQPSDTAEAAANADQMAEKFDDAIAKVSNPEVRERASALKEPLSQLADLLQQAATDPTAVDPEALQQVRTNGDQVFEDFSELCD